jgi:beclin 1
MDSSQILTESTERTDLSTAKSEQLNQLFYTPACQICGLLIQIDNSIEQINDVQYKQLSYSFATRDETETLTTTSDIDMEMSISANILNPANHELMREFSSKSYEPLYLKSVPPRSFYNNAYNPSILMSDLVQNSINVNLNTNDNESLSGWSARLNKISALCDLMSTNTNIDHPLCEECAEQLLNQLDSQCKLIQKEQSDYRILFNQLNEQTINNDELDVLENDLKSLEIEEKELIKQLELFENEEKNLKCQIEAKIEEEEKLLDQEEKYLIEYFNHQRALIKFEEKQSSLDNQLKKSKIHLNRLKTTNVLNAAFHIWHSGPFGTINYFRLGRLPDTPVEWDEINAGLGQVILLLQSLATRVKLDFKRFKLIPFGNYSYIEVIENVLNLSVKKGDHLNMYGCGGFKYYFDWDRKFDFGMVAFLDCLEQFENKIKSIDTAFSMPYPINGHELEDKKTSTKYSIRFQKNTHEEWTKALKYMLTNLKWSLAWVASQYD